MIMNTEKTVTISLKYLSERQLTKLLQMFDSKEAYAKNYPPLRSITGGLHELISEQEHVNPKIKKMFKAINDLQGCLILDNINEWNEVVSLNPL